MPKPELGTDQAQTELRPSATSPETGPSQARKIELSQYRPRPQRLTLAQAIPNHDLDTGPNPRPLHPSLSPRPRHMTNSDSDQADVRPKVSGPGSLGQACRRLGPHPNPNQSAGQGWAKFGFALRVCTPARLRMAKLFSYFSTGISSAWILRSQKCLGFTCRELGAHSWVEDRVAMNPHRELTSRFSEFAGSSRPNCPSVESYAGAHLPIKACGTRRQELSVRPCSPPLPCAPAPCCPGSGRPVVCIRVKGRVALSTPCLLRGDAHCGWRSKLSRVLFPWQPLGHKVRESCEP